MKAGATLPDGSYLYTALVHQHRASASPVKAKSYASFLAEDISTTIPNNLGRCAGHISRTYFADAISPEEVLQRHSLFGYFHLAYDKSEAADRESALVAGVRTPQSGGRATKASSGLRWCHRCSFEEREEFGFATWKVLHQISSIGICHIHGDRLRERCGRCGNLPGRPTLFRLPGEPCPDCEYSDVEMKGVVVSDVYQQFVRDVALAFSSQTDSFRSSAWASLVGSFVSGFSSIKDAELDVKEFLCQKWGLASISDICEALDIKFRDDLGVFGTANGSLCFRIVLYRAIVNLRPHLLSGECDPAGVPLDDSTCTSFAFAVRAHARRLNLGEALSSALAAPLSIRDAAIAAGLGYDSTYGAWKRISESMLAEMGDEAVRALLPKARRIHRVRRIKPGQDLTVAYQERIRAALDENPSLTRVVLWREHNRAMRYLSRSAYEWLAKTVGGETLGKRPKGR